MPPRRPIGRKIFNYRVSHQIAWSTEHTEMLTFGSRILRSSLMASSRAQNLTPSIVAIMPVFFPGDERLSNSFVSSSFPSTEKIASATRAGFTIDDGAGVNPETAHSLTPRGLLIEHALAASMKCSEMILMTHSPESINREIVSFGLSKPPENPTTNMGGS